MILGAVVHCEERDHYIQGILRLEENAQHSLMVLIERSITEESSAHTEQATTLTESHFRLSNMTNSMVIQKSMQENQLLGKLEEAENEIYALKRRIKEFEEEKAENDSKLNEIHGEYIKKEQEAKDYKIKYAELQETVEINLYLIQRTPP
jgi:predicted nuclease with TOPRIM domain